MAAAPAAARHGQEPDDVACTLYRRAPRRCAVHPPCPPLQPSLKVFQASSHLADVQQQLEAAAAAKGAGKGGQACAWGRSQTAHAPVGSWRPVLCPAERCCGASCCLPLSLLAPPLVLFPGSGGQVQRAEVQPDWPGDHTEAQGCQAGQVRRPPPRPVSGAAFLRRHARSRNNSVSSLSRC